MAAAIVGSALAVASPASAVSASVSGDKTALNQGDEVTVTVELDLKNGEQTPIRYHQLEIEDPGGERKAATFNANGDTQKRPSWLKSVKVVTNTANYGYGPNKVGYGNEDTNADFGYGYGYGYATADAELEYKVVIDTSEFEDGKWTLRFDTKATETDYIPYKESQTSFTFDVSDPSTDSSDRDWGSDDDDDDNDNSNTGNSEASSDKATVKASGNAEISVNDGGDSESISVNIKSAEAGESVDLSINKDEVEKQISKSGGAVENINVRFSDNTDFDMSVTYSSPENPDTGDEEISTSPTDNDDEVLGYISVDHDASDEAVDEVMFNFRVSEDRLGDREPEDIALYRYHDGEWTELETSFVEQDGSSYVFESNSPGLSVFAISQKSTPESGTTEATTQTPSKSSSTSIETAASAATSAGSPTEESDEDMTETGIPGFSAVLAVIALLAVAFIAVRRND